MTPIQAYLFGLGNGIAVGCNAIALAWSFL